VLLATMVLLCLCRGCGALRRLEVFDCVVSYYGVTVFV